MGKTITGIWFDELSSIPTQPWHNMAPGKKGRKARKKAKREAIRQKLKIAEEKKRLGWNNW